MERLLLGSLGSPAAASGRLALLDLGAHALFLLPQFGRELGPEVTGLEHRPDLDLGPAVEGRPLEPLDRLVDRLDLPQPVAGDQLLRLGARPVEDRAPAPGEPYALAPGAGVQPVARPLHARLAPVFAALAHCGYN